MFENNNIKDFSDNIYTKEEFLALVKNLSKNKYNVYIGTDSKIIKNKVIIVTAICFHKPNSKNTGNKIFYVKEKISKKECPTLRSRMLLEAYRSIKCAIEVEQYVDGRLEVHLDVGDTIKSKTSEYERELKAMVIGQGYNCEIKPNSWASSAVADKVVKS